MAARPLTYWRPSWILLKIDFRPLQHILWKILTRIVGLNSSLLLLVTVLQGFKVLQNPLFFTILPKNVYLWQTITQVLNWVLTTLNPLFGSKFSIEYLAMVKIWFWAKSKMATNRPVAEPPSWTTKSNFMENPLNIGCYTIFNHFNLTTLNSTSLQEMWFTLSVVLSTQAVVQ